MNNIIMEKIENQQTSQIDITNYLQKEVNQYIIRLNSLDFSDYESVLEWICKFEPISRTTGVVFDKDKILSIFKKNNFIPEDAIWRIDTNKDLNAYAKCSIGTVLGFLNFGDNCNINVMCFLVNFHTLKEEHYDLENYKKIDELRKKI